MLMPRCQIAVAVAVVVVVCVVGIGLYMVYMDVGILADGALARFSCFL